MKPDSTPIDPDDLVGLIPRVTTQGELNAIEHANILRAELRVGTDRAIRRGFPTPSGLCRLHGSMFGDVWRWAGRYRTRATSPGIAPELIGEAVARCCEDVRGWIEYDAYDWLERAVRFHHELVRIHPFPNGNGRLARLAADLLLAFNGRPRLVWAAGDLRTTGEQRRCYIDAMRAADDHDFGPLLVYVRGLQPDHGA